MGKRKDQSRLEVAGGKLELQAGKQALACTLVVMVVMVVVVVVDMLGSADRTVQASQWVQV